MALFKLKVGMSEIVYESDSKFFTRKTRNDLSKVVVAAEKTRVIRLRRHIGKVYKT